MPLGSWPDYEDDTGVGTDGTALDKALLDEVRDSIEDSIFSIANPTISPAEAIDELVDARGTFDTLDERLDDLEGTSGGGGSTTTGDSLAASDNVAYNPDLAAWKNGSALAPDHFTLSGTGAGVARVTGLGAGPFAARLTYGSSPALLTQDLISVADWTAQAALGSEGRKVSLTVRVQASIVDQASIVVDDGVTTTESDFHSGGGTPENLTVTHEISSSATKLSFYFKVAQSGNADFAGVVATYSDSPSPSWQPPPHYGHRILDINITPAGNVGAPATDLMSYKLAPGLLRSDGITIHVVAHGYVAANATAKKLDFKWGALVIPVLTNSTTYNNMNWWADVYISRTGSGAQAIALISGCFLAQFVVGSKPSTPAVEVDTAEIILKFIGDANANNDIVQSFMKVEILEPSTGI